MTLLLNNYACDHNLKIVLYFINSMLLKMIALPLSMLCKTTSIAPGVFNIVFEWHVLCLGTNYFTCNDVDGNIMSYTSDDDPV